MLLNYTLHVSVNDTLQVPGLVKPHVACPITHQEIIALAPNGSYIYPPGFAVNSTFNQNSNNLTVKVENNFVKGDYNFSIKATMRGGIYYSSYSNVSVICGPGSSNVTGDRTLDQMSKYQFDPMPYRFPPFELSNPNCPVIETHLVTDSGSLS